MGFLQKLKDGYWQSYRQNNGIVRNLDKVDLMTVEEAGRATLIIVTDKHCVDASPKSQLLLRDKVESYLNYITGDEFKQEFPKTGKNIEIIITFGIEPDPLLLDFIRSMVPWVRDNDANLRIEVAGKLRDDF